MSDDAGITARELLPPIPRRRHRLRRLDMMDNLSIRKLEITVPPQAPLQARQASETSAGMGESWNRLWLLFLIPVVLLAGIIIAAIWVFNRKRRQSQARESALRNVTLVIRDEERAREREERRLSRANSAMSRLGRHSSVKDAREQRYSRRISQAVAREEKTRVAEEGENDDMEEDAPILSRTLSDAARDPLKRKASVKHRDREVAERVWRIAGEDMGESPMPTTSAAHPKQLDKAWDGINRPIASASSSRNPSIKRTPSATKGKGRVREPGSPVQRTASSSSRNHHGHARHDSEALSVIGESSFSEGRPSGMISRGVSVDGLAALAPIPSVPRSEVVPTAEVAEEGEANSMSSEGPDQDAPISPSEATWLSRSNSKMSSSGSGYVSANSHLNSTAPGGTSPRPEPKQHSRMVGDVHQVVTPAQALPDPSSSTSSPPQAREADVGVPTASRAIERASGGGSATSTQSSQDPFKSPITASKEAHADPFANPARGPQGSPTQVDANVAAGTNAATDTAVSAAPALNVVMPSPEDEDPPGTSRAPLAVPVPATTAGGRTRTWSDVIRLKTPTPGSGRRPRTASPSGPNAGPVNRSGSGSKASRTSSTRSARRNKYPHFLHGTHNLQKTHSLSGATLAPGTRADPMGGADLRRAASTGATRGPTEAPLSPGSWAYTSRAAEWRAALDATSATARDNASAVPTISVTGAGDLIMPQDSGRPLERKPSIGVAGSRFRETFE